MFYSIRTRATNPAIGVAGAYEIRMSYSGTLAFAWRCAIWFSVLGLLGSSTGNCKVRIINQYQSAIGFFVLNKVAMSNSGVAITWIKIIVNYLKIAIGFC